MSESVYAMTRDIWYYGYSDDGSKTMWWNPELNSEAIEDDHRVPAELKQEVVDTVKPPEMQENGMMHYMNAKIEPETLIVKYQHMYSKSVSDDEIIWIGGK